uniref:Cupin type-1 domain-containing protein n=1 Tax=Tetradesmus obliquus TaxID=3088 RepID=A0A383W7J2_TETOB|eukprot:jgi/Sobl393_1/15814/SZX73617.1
MRSSMHWAVIAVACVSILLQSGCVAGQQLKYVEQFSKQPWQVFPGGRFKATTNSSMSATSMAGALFELKPGGVRELHWHNAAEWAIVLRGTCRATVLDEGKTHPTDTWDYTASDVWYFPPNLPHSVVGLAPSGCLVMASYKSPDTNELKALSASGWLATLNVDTAALALGVPAGNAKRMLDKSRAQGRSQFIAQGPVQQLASQQPSLPVKRTTAVHRFSLTKNKYPVGPDGSYVNKADVATFPAATKMSGAILRLAPGGMRTLHWHPAADEWQYVINGTVEVGVFTAPGESITATIGPGDVGFAPVGSGHYVRNIGKDPAYLVLVFNNGVFTSIDVSNFLGAVPPSWLAAGLGISSDEARSINYKLAGLPGRPVQKKPEAAKKAGRKL